jgi:hypothetical protein
LVLGNENEWKKEKEMKSYMYATKKQLVEKYKSIGKAIKDGWEIIPRTTIYKKYKYNV